MCLIDGREPLLQELDARGSCDLAYRTGDGRRLRVNVFRSKGSLSVVLRALPTVIPTLEDLALPKILHEIPRLNHGLVLVAGPAGSGKSTTLAAIINSINTSRAVHIMTSAETGAKTRPLPSRVWAQR